MTNFEERAAVRLGQRLYDERKSRGVNQREMAKLLGVSPSKYNRWEKGIYFPRVEMLVNVMDTLGMSLDELFGVSVAAKKEQDADRRAMLKQRMAAYRRDVDIVRDAKERELCLWLYNAPWGSGPNPLVHVPAEVYGIVLDTVRTRLEAQIANIEAALERL